MATFLIRFVNIVLVALLAGTMFGIWIGYNPADLSSATYVEQQQNTIRQLNTLMPLLGLLTILFTVASAFLHKKSKGTLVCLLVAAVFLVSSGLITRFGNQPINSIVMTWTPDAPPVQWMELRDKWWSLHSIRTILALVALGLIVWASLVGSRLQSR